MKTVLSMEKSRRNAHDSTRVVGTLHARASTNGFSANIGAESLIPTGSAPNFARGVSR